MVSYTMDILRNIRCCWKTSGRPSRAEGKLLVLRLDREEDDAQWLHMMI